MSRDATSRIAEMSPQQKRALLARLMQEKARAADPLERPVHRLFEAQAKGSPAALAVGFEGETLTYAELNARANRLAHHLRGLGVGPEVVVGLCVERGIDMVVGLLGILKAGGAYLPLDPGFPASRIAFMLRDASVRVLVTQESLQDLLDAGSARSVRLDLDRDAIELRPSSDPEQGATADNLAYAIYTSGSTGTPKGVMVPHRALTNFLLSMREQPGLSERDTLLAVTTLSFDIAALELFLPLVCGAMVEIASRETASDGARLIERLRATRATVMQATPASWRLLLESGWEGNASLTVFCGGEVLTRDLAERLLLKAGSVWNLYGPTETTIWSTLAKVESGQGAVPIGRPIANTRAYVLDAHLRPVPVGVAGELYLGGIGLARGYHARPGLTASLFVADPFCGEAGGRLYRTGDLARHRPDGVIECLGRVDGQVKIRGYRVELGEVESALSSHPEIREAAAAARDESTGEKRLVGYFVPRGKAPSEATLRAWLKERLPEYMVPSAFVVLDTMPMTPNGKIDRKALPDPDSNGGEGPASYVPPRGPIEEALVAIWSEVLGRARVGVHDNFFEMGGHSLMAAQLLARVRETFGVEPPLNDLFEAPTVSGLGRLVEDAFRSGAGFSLPPLAPVGRDGPLPASYAQQRMWFLDQLEPGKGSYNIPIVVRLSGALDVAALERAFNALASRHESLRTSFAAVSGSPVQVIADELTIDLPIEDLAGEPEAEALRQSREASWRPFDLSRGPLVRTRLYRLSATDHVLAVTMHHAISDGWSLGVLVVETGRLYEAFARGEDLAAAPRLWRSSTPTTPSGNETGSRAISWRRSLASGARRWRACPRSKSPAIALGPRWPAAAARSDFESSPGRWPTVSGRWAERRERPSS